MLHSSITKIYFIIQYYEVRTAVKVKTKYLFVKTALYLSKCIICHQYLNRKNVKIFYIAEYFFENKTIYIILAGVFLNSNTSISLKIHFYNLIL